MMTAGYFDFFSATVEQSQVRHNGKGGKGGALGSHSRCRQHGCHFPTHISWSQVALCVRKMRWPWGSGISQLEVGRERRAATRGWIRGMRPGWSQRGCLCPRIFVILRAKARMWNPICVILLPIIVPCWDPEMLSGWWTQRDLPFVPPFVCAEESLLRLFRWARRGPWEVGTPQSPRQAPHCLLSPVSKPPPSTS